MTVLMINGRPHKEGCTYTVLKYMADILSAGGICSEIIHVGSETAGGCMGCGGCSLTGRCITDDCVNDAIEKAKEAEGFVFASPVHYASPAGSMISFMDRFFYAGGENLRYKPAAIAVVARRGGCTSSYDALAKYPAINQMPIVSADYWPMIHGHGDAADVLNDKEGLFTMETAALNLAWLMKAIRAGKDAGIEPEFREKDIWTNFNR